MVATGSVSGLAFGYESTFKGGASSYDRAFGVNQRITGLVFNNSLSKQYELGSRQNVQLTALALNGRWGVECLLANESWLEGLFGTYTDNSGTGYTQYDYSVSNTVKSLAMKVGFTSGGSNYVREIKGAIINRARLSTRVGTPVVVVLDGVYATETTPTESVTNVTESLSPLTFAHGSLTVGGVAQAKVQSVELGMINNAVLTYGLGSRTAVDIAVQSFETELRITAVSEDDEWLEKAYGADSATSPQDTVSSFAVVLAFDTGDSVNDREFTFTISNAKIDSISQAYAPNDLILWDISLVGGSVTATYKKYTS